MGDDPAADYNLCRSNLPISHKFMPGVPLRHICHRQSTNIIILLSRGIQCHRVLVFRMQRDVFVVGDQGGVLVGSYFYAWPRILSSRTEGELLVGVESESLLPWCGDPIRPSSAWKVSI